MRLHAKLILVLLPLIALPLATLGWVAYSQQLESVEKEATRRLATLVNEVERHFDTRLEAARADALLFANARVLQRYLMVEDESQRFRLLQPSLLNLFAAYQSANPEYYEIRLLLPDGYEDTRATRGHAHNATDEEAETDYFRVMSTATDYLLTQVVQNPDSGEPAVMVSQRISLVDPSVDPVLAKPRLRGYLVLTMGLDFLHEQAHDIASGNSGRLVFVDAGGAPLFDASDQQHEHPLSPAVPRALIDAIEAGTLTAAVVGGEHHLMRGRRLHDNLYVLAMLPEAELLTSTRRIAQVALAMILGSIALTAALLYGFLRSLLLTPLVHLGRAAREIGRGNLVADVGIRRQDEIGEVATLFEEMSRNLRHSHEQIAHMAHHDSLTGLPNRRMFTQMLERAVVDAAHAGDTLGLLFLDLDDFKRVNDTLGHHAGDDLLREVGARLAEVLRSDDAVAVRSHPERADGVARLGGDEFVVLLQHLDRPLDAGRVARRLLDELARPIVLEGTELQVNASVGITVFPDDGTTVDELVKNADIAMYHAKEQGKNHYQFYTRALNNELVRRIELEGALRRALTRDELLLHYQPQVHAASGKVLGVEALIRWRHPEMGLVSPADFIPIAEETGLILPIGEWVLNEACRQARAWQDAGAPAVPVAVNISARQLSGVGLEDAIRRALADSGLAPEHLDVELTETSVMREPERAVQTLRAVKAMGVRISMDDFGTGYSSLGILRRLPIDCLKIDKSFVDQISANRDDTAITVAIIAMARSLGLQVIAEGVEHMKQVEFLRAQGCEVVQGYLMSRPVPAAELMALLTAPRLPLPPAPATAMPGTEEPPAVAQRRGAAG